ncbi:MAG: PQQ-binding-like beta-propeller repeat protein [Gemmataceae bacterium]
MIRRLALVVAVLVVVGLAAYVAIQQFRPGLFEREAENPDELAALKSAPLPAVAADAGSGWPQWFGPNRDGHAPPGPLRTDWATNPPKPVWSVPCGGGYSSLAVVGGLVYTQDRQEDRERVLCLHAASGNTVWAYGYRADYAGVGYAAGPRATPTVHGGRVYALGATGKLVCLAPHDPVPVKVVWARDLRDEFAAPLPQWGFASSPLIEGDLVIVQAGGKKGAVLAFDKTTGDTRWAAGTDPAGYSSPVAATVAGVRQVIAVTGTSVLGIAPADGKVLWQHPWATQHNGNIAAPLVVGDYVFVSAGYAKGCALLRLTTAGGGLKAEQVYFRKARVMQNHHSTSVHRDGFVYGYDNDTLRCVDLRKGEAVEEWVAKDAGGSRPAKGSVILAGDKLIGLTQTGTLFLADADPAEFRFRGKLEGVLSGSDCWASPVLVDGRLYLRDNTKVVCLDAR